MNRKNSLVFVHPAGTPFASHAAHAFQRNNMLNSIITSFSYRRTGSLKSIIKHLPDVIQNPLERELKRRDWIIDDSSRVLMYPIPELVRMTIVKLGIQKLLNLRYQYLVDQLYTSIDRSAANFISQTDDIAAIYSYEDCASLCFEEALRRNIHTIYDLPILHHKSAYSILEHESELYPQFKEILLSTNESPEKIDRKEKEIALSKHIIAASSITKESLTKIGTPSSTISVVPYGIDLDLFNTKERSDKIFRVLFVGRIGPRKGVHYLIDAWKKLNLPHAELMCVGINEFSNSYLSQISSPSIRILPSVPHRELPISYGNCDVFILPSLVEGFGMVLLEAMASGKPIIASTHTAAPDLIDDGKQGFIIPPRNLELMMEKIEFLYSNRDQCFEMGKNARERASLYPWSRYEDGLIAAVKKSIVL